MRTLVGPIAVAVVVALSGCSSDDSGDKGSGDTSAAVPGAAGADLAQVSRTGLDAVRGARSLRVVLTIQPDGGEKTVLDIRIVPGQGSRSSNVFNGIKSEELVVGGDVFRRFGDKKPWRKSSAEPGSAGAADNTPWHEQIPRIGQDLYDLVARSETLVAVAPVTIGGVRCPGVRGDAGFTYYFAPGDAGGLRRWVREQPGARTTWDISELNKPIDLTPPTDIAP